MVVGGLLHTSLYRVGARVLYGGYTIRGSRVTGHGGTP